MAGLWKNWVWQATQARQSVALMASAHCPPPAPPTCSLLSSSAGRFVAQKSLATSPAFPMLAAERHRLFGHKDLLYLMRSKRVVSLEIITLPPVTEERAIPRTQQRQLVNGNPYWK